LSTSGPDRAGEEALAIRLAWPGAPRHAEDRRVVDPPTEDAVPEDPPGAPLRALPVLEAGPEDTTPLRRAVVDAYDRLADQVLGRMRALHQDVDADLAEVRSELASLRRSVEDVGDRVQLRQLRTSLDELRADVAGLRRAVLESPEPGPGGPGAPGTAAAQGAAAEQLALLREEVVSLRRRIALRGRAEPAEPAPLTDDDVDRIAAAVAARLAPPSRRSR
jgi:hypothetical protein